MSRLPQKLKTVRWGLIAPFLVLFLLGMAYAVWWNALSNSIENALLDWRSERSEQGLAVTWDNLETGGFPYRLEMTLTAPAVGMPNAQAPWGWSAGSVNAQMLPYNLNHVIVDVQSDQIINYSQTNEGLLETFFLHISSEKAWASLVRENADENRLAVDLTNLFIHREQQTSEGPVAAGIASATRLQLHGRPSPDSSGPESSSPDSSNNAFHAAFRAEDIAWENFGPAPWPGSRIARLDVQARFSGLPEDLLRAPSMLLQNVTANNTTLAISEFVLHWGPIDMTGRGEVTLDEKGRPEGRFHTSVGNLDSLIAALVEAGIVSQRSAGLAFAGITALSSLQGAEPGRVHLPVVMKEGVLFLGPIAVTRLDPLY